MYYSGVEGASSSTSTKLIVPNGSAGISNSVSVQSLGSSSVYSSVGNLIIDVDEVINGSLGVYASTFCYANSSVSIVSPSSPSIYAFELSYADGTLQRISSSGLGVSMVRLNGDLNPNYSYGRVMRIKGRIGSIDSISVLHRINIAFSDASYVFGSGTGTVYASAPSVSFVSGEASDLDALEGIADSIAAQSEIMSAMYADIMSLLNDLYKRLGDMQAVEELTNTYFAQLIPLVNSINTNTANIYSLLQTQFQLLRTLIATESDDIQAAIEKQTQDLKAYFDAVFSGAVGDMPEKSDDLETSVGDFSSAEQDYQSNASARFDELAASFNGFSGGTLSGITLASTLFTRVWNALGEYSIVYLYPLLLGLCLLLIGRLSRLSGGQSSSEKHRGDSDA